MCNGGRRRPVKAEVLLQLKRLQTDIQLSRAVVDYRPEIEREKNIQIEITKHTLSCA